MPSQDLQTCGQALPHHSRVSEEGAARSSVGHLCMTIPQEDCRWVSDRVWKISLLQDAPCLCRGTSGQEAEGRTTQAAPVRVCVVRTPWAISQPGAGPGLYFPPAELPGSAGLGGPGESVLSWKDFLPTHLFPASFLTLAQNHEPFWD